MNLSASGISLGEREVAQTAHEAGLGDFACVIDGLDDGFFVDHRGGEPIYPASMIKLPIALSALVWAEGRRLAGEADPVVLETHAHQMTSNDAPSPFIPGYRAPLEAYVHAAIVFSDNVATNVLLDAVGRERATTIALGLGLTHTAMRRYLSGALPRIDDPLATGENEHPAGDAARLLRLVATGAVPQADRLLDALAAQHWNTKLSRGLRASDRFAHKTGDTSDVSHDGGILTTAAGRRYIIVAYAATPSNDATDDAFAAFMQAMRPRLGD